MPCLTAEVADAVAQALNEGPLAAPIGGTSPASAVRKWYALYTLQDLAELRVTVCPGALVETRISREGCRHTRYVWIITQQKVDPTSNPQVDAIMALVESFIDFVMGDATGNEQETGLEISTESGMPFILDEPPATIDPAKAPVDPAMLTNLHVFTSALKLTMVSRTPGARGV